MNTYTAEFIAEATSLGLSAEDYDQWGSPEEQDALHASEVRAERRNEVYLFGDF